MAPRPFPRAEYRAVSPDDELPVSDGVPMESENDAMNARLYLCEPLKGWGLRTGTPLFVGSNSFVYYALGTPPVGPDFYAVKGGVQGDKDMWVAWRENGLMPSLVAEFLSKSTVRTDRGKKMKIYRDHLRCSDYLMCRLDRGLLEGYQLHDGVYVPTLPDGNGRLRLASLPLLVGFHGGWLRFFELDGTLVPTDAEREQQRADQEQQRAEQERQRADQEQQRAEQERQRAEQEQQRAEQERRRADAERLRAEQALEELRALRARLEEKGQ